jgi:hypothetical protein
MHRRLAAAFAFALAFPACSNGDHENATSRPESSTTKPRAGAPLPGERVEIYPYRGARLSVVGVAGDDTLSVRSGPGTDFEVVFDLHPLAMNVTATGHNRSVGGGSGFWSEIIVDGRTGWANSAFLLQSGAVTDITAALFPDPAGRPTAASMRELGQGVARLRASEEPASDIVVVDEPPVGDLGEITVDVIGLGDDAVGGERLKIFAEPGSGGRPFTVRTVEATSLCSRGVTGEGLCV